MKKKLVAALSGLALLASTGCGISNIPKLQNKMIQSYAACIDKQYDMDTRCLKDSLAKAYNSVYEIQIETVYKSISGKEDLLIGSGAGTGILLEGGQMLTAYHVGHSDTTQFYDENGGQLGTITNKAYIKLSPTERYPLEELFGDRTTDFAIMQIPEGVPVMRIYPYAIGNSDDITVGNVTYIAGNAMSGGINLRQGIVSQLFADEQSKISGIGISNGINLGDSGSPLFAIRDGKIELTGIVIQKHPSTDHLGYAVSMNAITTKLAELMAEKDAQKK